jgi:hypothetical protein
MAGTYNISLDQGSDYSLVVTYKDSNGVGINLTGMTLSGHARANKEESKIFEFSFTIANQGTDPGKFTMTLANSVSSALDISKNNKFFYDVELTNGSTKTRLFEGIVTLSREITR